MDANYINKLDYEKCIGHFIEEAGESLAAAGKTVRFGRGSVNPELPLHKQEMNADWLLRELDDLQAAMNRLRPHLIGNREDG